MNSALPSHTATFRPMTSSLVGSLASLPTATISILNATNTNTTSGHSYRTKTDCSRDTLSTWIETSYMLVSIVFFVHFFISYFEVSKSRPHNNIPKYRNNNQEKEGLKNHGHILRSQIWEENYQNDASRMEKIQTLAQDSSNAIDPESRVHFLKKYAAAKKNRHLVLLEEILQNRRVLSSKMVEDMMEEGRYQSVPRYRPEDQGS
ncbi:hypothetical protein OCU04_008387 [Sclerotinia nivalis]|uniref:Uncharacterized protein n=1 Tax=Sclerotinia nivalis TaxID=352851 RepID=A0A9X0AHZ7_9HELO|nr:hypothetical protein OCU04_008387 [Sclerotinia nivalis]